MKMEHKNNSKNSAPFVHCSEIILFLLFEILAKKKI